MFLFEKVNELTPLPAPERYSLAESFRLWEGHLTLVDFFEHYRLSLALAHGYRSCGVHHDNLLTLLRLLGLLLLLLLLLLLITHIRLLCVTWIIRVLVPGGLPVFLMDCTMTF